MEKKTVFIILAVAIVGLIIWNIAKNKGEEGKILDYNRCVSSEMTKYYNNVKPMTDLCARGEAVACKVLNEGIEKKKIEVQRVCNIYLD